MQTQLMRTNNEKVVGGVCGGLARYFGIDPVLVRLAFVVLTVATGIGLPVYLVLWLITPADGQPAIWHHAVQSAQQWGQQVSQTVQARVQPQTQPQPRFDPQTGQPLSQPITVAGRNQKLGYVLMGIGGLMLASMFHMAAPMMAVALLGTGWYLLRKTH